MIPSCDLNKGAPVLMVEIRRVGNRKSADHQSLLDDGVEQAECVCRNALIGRIIDYERAALVG